jgi:hypothetical protein
MNILILRSRLRIELGIVLGIDLRDVLRTNLRDVLRIDLRDVLRIDLRDVLRIDWRDMLRIDRRDMLRIDLGDVCIRHILLQGIEDCNCCTTTTLRNCGMNYTKSLDVLSDQAK